MLDYVSGAVRVSLVTFALCGFAYPLAVTGVGQLVMPYRANGSVLQSADGRIIGSRLIGQQWNDAQWFRGRPSATVDLSDSTKAAPYNAANTTASNLGPTSKALQGPPDRRPRRPRSGAAGARGQAAPRRHAHRFGFGSRPRHYAGQCFAAGGAGGQSPRCAARASCRSRCAAHDGPQPVDFRRAAGQRLGAQSGAGGGLSKEIAALPVAVASAECQPPS